MANGDRSVRYMRLGSLALVGGAVVVFLLWVLFFWVAARRPLSGVDGVHGFLIRLTTLVPAVLIILAHLAVARQLRAAARERSTRTGTMA